MSNQTGIGMRVLSVLTCAVSLARGSEWESAWAFREAVGGGSFVDWAALGASATAQDAFVEGIRAHFATGGTGYEPLDDLATAQRRVSDDLSWGRDTEESYTRLEAARDEAAVALADLMDQSRTALPAALRPYLDRARLNSGIDSPYRLLALSEAQREQVRVLQRQRDRVLGDARQRHRPERLAAANEAFEAQVQRVLTPTQRTELAQFQANIAANLETVLDHELADYPEDPTGEDAEQTSFLPKLIFSLIRAGLSQAGPGWGQPGSDWAGPGWRQPGSDRHAPRRSPMTK